MIWSTSLVLLASLVRADIGPPPTCPPGTVRIYRYGYQCVTTGPQLPRPPTVALVAEDGVRVPFSDEGAGGSANPSAAASEPVAPPVASTPAVPILAHRTVAPTLRRYEARMAACVDAYTKSGAPLAVGSAIVMTWTVREGQSSGVTVDSATIPADLRTCMERVPRGVRWDPALLGEVRAYRWEVIDAR